MNLKALREKRAKAVADMRGILAKAETENREALTADEQAEYDRLKAEVDTLGGTISMLEGQDALEAAMAEPRVAAARGQGDGLSEGRHAPGDPANREFETFGQFMAAVRFNPNDSRLDYHEGGENAAVLGTMGDDGQFRADQRMDTGSAGGFMVPTQFRTEIMKVDPASAIIRPRATIIPAGSPPDAAISIPALDQTGAAPGNMFGGVEVQWIAEGVEKPETEAKLREVKLEPFEVAGLVTVTDKLLRNWQAAGPFLENLLRGAVNQAEDFAFISGDGVGKPQGVLHAGNSAALSINRTTANLVKYADLVAMAAVMLMRGGSPIFTASQSVLPQIMTLKDDLGQLIYQPNAQLGSGQTLLGYPLRWNNRQPGLGNRGDIALLDAAYYLIKDGSGPFVAASEHVLFKQNKTVIKIFWNVDGEPWLSEPFTEENGYQVSPFVVLDDPA